MGARKARASFPCRQLGRPPGEGAEGGEDKSGGQRATLAPASEVALHCNLGVYGLHTQQLLHKSAMHS